MPSVTASPLLRVFCSSAVLVVTSSVPLIGAVRPPSGWGNLALFHRSGAVRRLSAPLSGLPLQTPHSVSSGGLSRLPGQPFPLTGSELDWRAFPGFSIRGAAGHLLVLLSWFQKRRPRRDVPILYQLRPFPSGVIVPTASHALRGGSVTGTSCNLQHTVSSCQHPNKNKKKRP